jgi:hypothetical protein
MRQEELKTAGELIALVLTALKRFLRIAVNLNALQKLLRGR